MFQPLGFTWIDPTSPLFVVLTVILCVSVVAISLERPYTLGKIARELAIALAIGLLVAVAIELALHKVDTGDHAPKPTPALFQMVAIIVQFILNSLVG